MTQEWDLLRQYDKLQENFRRNVMSSIGKDLPGWLRSGIRRHRVPGASVAILRGRRIIASAAAGKINLDTGVRTTTDTVFQIGSISKILTTTLIMQLVEEGKVSLDAPVVEYLPDFRVADALVSKTVTIRQLLSHQSGIDGDLFVDSGRGDDSIRNLLAKATMMPSLFPPGAKHSYCNLGFAVLGRVIEVMTRQTYDAVLKERIFEPLEMHHAISLPEDTLRFRCAIGHVPSRRKKNVWYTTRVPYLSFGQKAAGSTPAMSAPDLLKFARMHLDNGCNHRGEKILSRRSVRAMQKRQIRVQRHSNSAVTGWGLGWSLMDWEGERLYGHDGATLGQFAFLRILPSKNLAVALLTNGGDAKGLSDDLFPRLFTGLARIAEPPPASVNESLRPDPVRYTGTYANITGEFVFSDKAGRLVVSSRPNGGVRAFPDDSRLSFIDSVTARFDTGDPLLDRSTFLFSERNDSGCYEFVAAGFRQHRRVRKSSVP